MKLFCKTTERSQIKNKKKQKKNRLSEIYGNTVKYLTFLSSESQRERREDGGAEKGLAEVMAENVLDLARHIKL